MVCQRVKASSSTCRVESIVLHSHGLVKSFETVCYCRSSITSVLCDHGSAGIEVSCWWLIELALPIDPDRLQMQSLGQSNAPFILLRLFRCPVWASYDQDSQPHLLSLAHCHTLFCTFFCACNGCSFLFRWNGTETSPFFHLLLYVHCQCTGYVLQRALIIDMKALATYGHHSII